MRLFGRRMGVALAAVIALSGATTTAASAATASSPRVTPDTGVISCLSPLVWLRLWANLGETCYSGNGNIFVNRSGVYQEQIVGLHTVCLYGQGIFGRCSTGPNPHPVRIFPPINVREITIRTP